MLASALNDMVLKLQTVVADVGNATDNVAAGSEELSASSESLSQGATEQLHPSRRYPLQWNRCGKHQPECRERQETDSLANKALSTPRKAEPQ